METRIKQQSSGDKFPTEEVESVNETSRGAREVLEKCPDSTNSEWRGRQE